MTMVMSALLSKADMYMTVCESPLSAHSGRPAMNSCRCIYLLTAEDVAAQTGRLEGVTSRCPLWAISESILDRQLSRFRGCATASQGGVSLSVCILWRLGRSTGSDYKSRDCLPKYCLCCSSLRMSDTDNPNTRYPCRMRSPHTMGPHKPEPLDRRTHQQKQQWQQQRSGASSQPPY
jgi:hypothetical protein